MQLIKRLAIWLLETLLEVVLLAPALMILFGHNPHAVGRSLVGYAAGIVLLSFTTGYLLTTAVARAAWRGQKWWSYSTLAVALFLIHSQIFFVISGGSTRSDRLLIQLAGSCVVFVCTFLGSLVLRRWTSARQRNEYA
jgi:hypothetical protein